MRPYPTIFIIFALPFLPCAFGLESSAKRVVFSANIGENIAKLQFTVTNSGKATERITKIDGGCSCIELKSDKDLLKPGESSVISGSIDFGTSAGRQRKTVSIHYAIDNGDVTSEPIVLKVAIEGEIPSPIKVSKTALIWLDGEKTESKAVMVDFKPEYVVKSVVITKAEKADDKGIFGIHESADQQPDARKFEISISSTDLPAVSPRLRDYFATLLVTYIIEDKGVIRKRSERLDLLLAKDPNKKYGEINK